MEGSSGGPSWLDLTKTKLLVLSSLVGVGTIIYFTKNYLEKGYFLPHWSDPSVKKSSMKQPTVIGGKRNVIIKEDSSVKGSISGQSRKLLRHQRSRRSSTSSSRRRDSISSRGKDQRSYAFRKENIDMNLNHAITELADSVNEVEEILGIKANNTENHEDNNKVIEGEIHRLRELIDFAQDVQLVGERTSDYVLKHQKLVEDIASSNDVQGCSYEELTEEVFNVDDDYDSDNDSFISATESIDLEISDDEEYEDAVSFGRKLKELILKHSKNDFYMHGIEYLTHYGVPVRTLRTQLLECDNDVDFCVKVYCLRRAFADIMKNEEHRKWFVETGREMIVSLFKGANYDHLQFAVEYDKMVDYCSNSDNWSDIDVDISGRGVCCLNFYDIVLDFLIMDSFQDLESPPYTVTTAIQNRWLSIRIKETALSTAIWTVIKTKKRRLENQDGFLAHFYNISMHITPLLAWGFLGPVKELNDLCLTFKDSLIGFLRDIFSADSANYKSVQTLAEDVLTLAKKRKEELMSVISR